MSELLREHHRLIFHLEDSERLTLEEALHHHPRPDVRERCSALLQVAAGASYSPWLNPIEKLWRKMRQELTAMHQVAANWKQVQAFFARFANGSSDLLRYVGLQGDGKLATALRSP